MHVIGRCWGWRILPLTELCVSAPPLPKLSLPTKKINPGHVTIHNEYKMAALLYSDGQSWVSVGLLRKDNTASKVTYYFFPLVFSLSFLLLL